MDGEDYEPEEPFERAEPGERLARRRTPVHEPRSRVRKFVYLVVALLPFVAFILLLPRGGEEAAEEVEPDPTLSPAGVTSTTSVQLAFPLELLALPSPEASPTSAPEDIPLEAPGSTQCSDGVDNDRDGRTDLADAGCNGTRDNSESPNPVRRTAAPPAPPPPPPAPAPSPAPMPPPPTVPPAPEPQPPPPPLPPPSGPACNPGDPGFPTCSIGNGNDDGDDGQDSGEEQ